MTIKAASAIFNKLLKETTNKSELKIYKRFIALLKELEEKALSELQLKTIEDALEALYLNEDSEDKRKFYKKKYSEFAQVLRSKLSMITSGFYTAIGLSLGMSFGMVFGIPFTTISNGLIFGMMIGLAIGAGMDMKAKNDGLVLKTNLF